ncbi:MAG: DNA translocase FtsK [Oscillospiraceae bacterium]|nr:DNA translocase FtsK [Oscillospiraceae bacterium]
MAERKNKSSSDSKDSKENKTPEKNEKIQFYSVLLFALGILTALIVVINGTDGWKAMHNVLLGIFGVSVIAIPVILIYTALLMGKEDRNPRYIIHQVLWGIGLTVLFSSLVQLYFVGDFKSENFTGIIKSLYNGGKNFRGGGVASLIFAGLLLKFFGVVGARIIAGVITCVFAMMLADISLYQLFDYMKKPFQLLIEFSHKLKDNWENELFEYDDDEDEEDDDEINTQKFIEDKSNKSDQFSFFDDENSSQEQTVNPESSKSKRKAKRKSNDDVQKENTENSDEINNIDIVIEENVDNNSDNGSDNIEENSKENEELDKLINRAAELKPVSYDNNIDIIIDDEYDEDESIPISRPEYKLPSMELLTIFDSSANAEAASAEMREKADIIVNTLKSFGVGVKISDIYRGPSITRYEIQPAAGIKVSRIKGLEDDISLYLAAQGVRIEAPVPGKACVGIEVPNTTKDTVSLREILVSKEFRTSKSKLTFAVGKDIAGNVILGDIAKMPHVIIAGTTGSGKSVCTRSIIMSILYNTTPDEVRIILIDPKIVEFKTFEGIPQLLIPVVTDPKKAAGALNWAVNEMIRRYKIFADNGANDLHSFNEIAVDDDILSVMPQIVIFIDELADLMIVAGKEVEDSICRLAQMGRASGIHLVIATQRPTTDVITGLIKANIPSRIALSVKSQVDSRTIIDMAGADKLLGNGDMLYYPIGASKPVRVQGCFASSKDIERTVEFVRSQMSEEYDDNIMQAVDEFVPTVKEKDSFDNSSGNASDEDIIEQAIVVAVENGQLSTSLLQRKLKLGYARAARIMDELEDMGVIGPSEGAKPRKVLMSQLQFEERRARKLK